MATITLTVPQMAAILWALGEVVDGNARSHVEMRKCGVPVNLIRPMMRAQTIIDSALDAEQARGEDAP